MLACLRGVRPVFLGVLGASLLISASSYADQQGPASYTLVLTPQMLLIVAKGVQELPYKDASPVLTEIQRQVTEQSKPQEPPKPEQK